MRYMLNCLTPCASSVAELRDVVLDRAEDAEAIAGLVVDELAVPGALRLCSE